MLRDRGDVLKYALANALREAAKVVRGARAGLTVSEREAVAERAVTEIRNLPDDPWKLAEQLPHDWNNVAVSARGYRGGSTPDNWCKPAHGRDEAE
jgi:hypothetical protein